jgi:hypothetical protein
MYDRRSVFLFIRTDRRGEDDTDERLMPFIPYEDRSFSMDEGSREV